MPIETQALMVEVFHEIAQDTAMVDGIKLWLLKQRKGKQWHTTKSTASACAALFLVGDNWLADDKDLEMELGGKPVVAPAEAKSMGARQFTVSWQGADIKPAMTKLTMANPNKVPAWGAMHYQYFEDYDKVTSFLGTPVKVSKTLFVKRDTLERVSPNTVLKVGELVVVRIALDVEKSLEFVHVKDSRSSSFEPTNVFSGYKYQNRLSYYETTRDASTNFFLDYLPVGKHQLEYSVRVTHKGDFSNGVTTVQSMYAPEFTSHSEAVRVKVR